jgi:hypothetical protein
MNTRYSNSQVSCVLLSLLFTLASGAACSRMYYRNQADDQVYCLVDTVAARTGEAEPNFGIEINPQSRMYDPNSPDFPPMPPDDPEAHTYMHCVDCKKGYPCWHCNGDTPYVANPYWLQYLPRNEKGELVLDMRGAVDVALVNSTDYQQQLETLYLSALDVTFERFRFDAQFFGGSSIFYTADGANRPGGGGNSSSLLNVSPFDPTNRLRVERMFAGGGELVVGLANSIVWQFSGPDSHSYNTLLDFSFVQPLLRAGGRARVLERLTIAERTLLANVRQMERFRRGFYAEITTGRDAGQGPQRRGGFFGGSGLEGFSGVGGGGFGRIGSSGGIGTTNTGAGAAGAGGYMGLLQSTQEIRNLQANVDALRVSLAQLQAFAAAGRLGNRAEVQLGQAASALYDAESRLLTSKAQYQSDLDTYKVLLGMPPNLPVKIEDSALDQFNLIDPQLVKIQRTVEELLDETRKIEFADLEREDAKADAAEAAAAAAAAGVAKVPAEPQPAGPELVTAIPPEVDVEALLKTAAAVRKEVQAHLLTVDADLKKLDAIAGTRRNDLRRLAAREEVKRQDIDQNLLDSKRFDQRIAALKEDYLSLQQRFECDWKTLQTLRDAHAAGQDLSLLKFPCREKEMPLLDPDAPVEDAPAPGDAPRDIPDPFADDPVGRDRTPWTTVLTELSRDLLELTLVQARMRTNSVVLLPIDMTSEQALRIASQNRRDWANARNELVNAWRLIQFNANALQSGLDLTFSGDVGNLGMNPAKLDASTGRLRVGLRFDAPLTRLAERNIYRQSLIEYQQARRNYYKLVDQINRSLRLSLRTIQLNDLNFELRREAVQVALRRYHFTLLDLDRPASRTAPAGPGQLAEGGEDFGATTARDMVDALSGLQNAQNDFLSVWVNYEVQRLSLDFDLGTMQLDPNGQWIDPGKEIGYEDSPVLRPGGHGDYNASEEFGNDWRGFYDPCVGPIPPAAEDVEGYSDLEVLQLPEIMSVEEAQEKGVLPADKTSAPEDTEGEEVNSDPYETTATEAEEIAQRMAHVRNTRAGLNGSGRMGWTTGRKEPPAMQRKSMNQAPSNHRPAHRTISRANSSQHAFPQFAAEESGDANEANESPRPQALKCSQELLASSKEWLTSRTNSLVTSLQPRPAKTRERKVPDLTAPQPRFSQLNVVSVQESPEQESPKRSPELLTPSKGWLASQARSIAQGFQRRPQATNIPQPPESKFAEQQASFELPQPAAVTRQNLSVKSYLKSRPSGQDSSQQSPPSEYPRKSASRPSQQYSVEQATVTQPIRQIFPAPGAMDQFWMTAQAEQGLQNAAARSSDGTDDSPQNPPSPAGFNQVGDGWRAARSTSENR